MLPFTSSDDTFHELYTFDVFVGTKYLGRFLCDSGRDDLGWRRTGYSFFCRWCGSVWATMVASRGYGTPPGFTLVPAMCEQHGEGSLLVGDLENLLDDLPPEAVKREFLLHLNQVEKELRNE